MEGDILYCVYLHRNKINNKVYIGQTKFGDNPNKRWLKGEGYNTQPYFYEDIKRYGWDNFDHTILANNLTLEQANSLEKDFIEAYESLNPSLGYNQMAGGGNTLKVSTALSRSQSAREDGTTYFNDENGILRTRKTAQSLESERARYLRKYNALMERGGLLI